MQSRAEGVFVLGSRHVPYLEMWPQKLKYTWLASLALPIFVAWAGVISIAKGVRQSEAGMVIGFTAFLMLVTVASVFAIRSAGFRSVSLSRRVLSLNADHRVGIRIPKRRDDALLAILFTCGAVTGLTTASTWYFGLGETLLPTSRDTSGGANYMAIAGIVSLLLALLSLAIQENAVLNLAPSGIQYLVRRRRFFRTKNIETFVEWDRVEKITPDTQIVTTGASQIHNPLINICASPTTDSYTDSGTDEETVIRVYQLVSEPNTLFSLMQYMKDHPEERELLAQPESLKLLTPPPLRARFRSARKSKSSVSSSSGTAAPPNA
ncbi:hypothetical protein [Rhodococcus marinonascens]|uniref:hypothetical protein n=1 Tax=Rhodococcus marinonascens TaxID=38311 RepID=UPI000B215907|nr:hypothetical protein [Rhodococcus marinonascens]